MRRQVSASLVLAATFVSVAAGPIGSSRAVAADAPTTHQVVIQGLQYVPATLTVKRGDVVVWVNKDPFPHTVTAPGGFDSREIAAGKSWRFTASRAGVFPYLCTLHTTMKGVLQVE
ncbi:MAG: cupredoxin domain-containing protein [Caldimonas sp.]